MTDHLIDKPIAERITDRRRIAELSAVALTGFGKAVFMDYLDWTLVYVSVAIVGWAGYIALCHRALPGILKHWGFRTDNFVKVARTMLLFVVFSAFLFCLIGAIEGTIHLSWQVLPLLVLYPLWGTIQQFLMIGLVAGNLRALQGKRSRTSVIVLVTALLFASVHFPDRWLTCGTFVLALFYGYVYLKQRNLYVLGIAHGWLGALFYYTVVDRDPFLEVFGNGG
jgi:uncharacterized protein